MYVLPDNLKTSCIQQKTKPGNNFDFARYGGFFITFYILWAQLTRLSVEKESDNVFAI